MGRRGRFREGIESELGVGDVRGFGGKCSGDGGCGHCCAGGESCGSHLDLERERDDVEG